MVLSGTEITGEEEGEGGGAPHQEIGGQGERGSSSAGAAEGGAEDAGSDRDGSHLADTKGSLERPVRVTLDHQLHLELEQDRYDGGVGAEIEDHELWIMHKQRDRARDSKKAMLDTLKSLLVKPRGMRDGAAIEHILAINYPKFKLVKELQGIKVDVIAQDLEWREYASNTRIFRQGSLAQDDGIFFILSGLVQIFVKGGEGDGTGSGAGGHGGGGGGDGGGTAGSKGRRSRNVGLDSGDSYITAMDRLTGGDDYGAHVRTLYESSVFGQLAFLESQAAPASIGRAHSNAGADSPTKRAADRRPSGFNVNERPQPRRTATAVARSREQLECVCLVLPPRNTLERRQSVHITERRRSLSMGVSSPTSELSADLSEDGLQTGVGSGDQEGETLPSASVNTLVSSSPSPSPMGSRLHTILGHGHTHFEDLKLKINMLRNSVLFSHCDLHDLTMVAETMEVKVAMAGHIVKRTPDQIIMVMSGELELGSWTTLSNKAQRMSIALLSAGDFFGLADLIEGAGEDPSLFAFAKSNMEYAELSVELLQNTIANNSKTLKRMRVLVGKRRRWESCRRDYYLNHETAPANVTWKMMAACSQYAAVPTNAMSKAELTEYIEAGGKPHQLPLPKPTSGRSGGDGDGFRDRRIRSNAGLSGPSWSSGTVLSPSPPSGRSSAFSKEGKGSSPRDAAVLRRERASAPTPRTSAPGTDPSESLSTSVAETNDEPDHRAQRRAFTKASIRSSLAKIDALLGDTPDDDGFGPSGVGAAAAAPRRSEEGDLPITRGTFPAMKPTTNSIRDAAERRQASRGGGTFGGHGSAGGSGPSPPSKAKTRRKETEAKIRQWREASGDELTELLLRRSTRAE